MALLCGARLTVALVPFGHWRRSLGCADADAGCVRKGALSRARSAAACVERAAARLPFSTKCLPRAMALSWMLRRENIGHTVVIAVRPIELRGAPDALHAWVEVHGAKILGDLPGRWVETLRLGP